MGKDGGEEKKVNGRPTIYSEELAATICQRIAEGELLCHICQDDDMPARSTVHLWVIQDREGFSDLYARARKVQALDWAEEVLSISDNESKDWKVDKDGNLIVEREQVQRSRLRVDTRKWLLSKVLPKVYGDALELKHSGEIRTGFEGFSDEELRRKAEEFLKERPREPMGSETE